MPKPHADGLIFDLDGTLVDSMADLAAAVNHARGRFGMAPVDVDTVRANVGSGAEHLVRRTVPVPEAQFEEAYACYLAYYEAHLLDHTHLHAGVETVLAHYAGRPLAVISNKSAAFTERLLEALGIRAHFHVVLGGDSLPEKKPHPLPVLHVLHTCGLTAERTVMVGDGPHDVRAGRAAGVHTVAVTTGTDTRQTLQAAGAEHVIDRLDELLGLYA